MKGRRLILYPYTIWAIIFILAPLLLVVFLGFTSTVDGETVFSLANFEKFFSDPIYWKVFLRSVGYAVLSTVICLLLGYPLAYILASSKSRHRGFLLLLVILPTWINLMLRTYAWLSLLENSGLINRFLALLGLPPFEFMYHGYSIVFGMVYNFLPFMVLPIHSVMVKLNESYVEAARDLGANGAQVFFRITLPLSMPGVMSGITMVFMPAVTTFAISDILGGRKIQLLGNLIHDQFKNVFVVDSWNFGSAISVVLIVAILLSMAITSKVDKNGEGGGLF